MLFWFGILSYLAISVIASLLDTVAGTITFLVTLVVCLLGFSVLLCLVVRRGNRQERKLEHTSILPSMRARKTRQRYLP